jgi:hypothetical protein
VLRDPGALNAARHRRDSAEAVLRLGDFAVHGRRGDRITLALHAGASVAPAVGTDQRLFARIGSRIRSYTIDELRRGVAVHVFSDSLPVVQVEYSMNRRVHRPVTGRVSLIQRVGSATVLRANTPWAAREPRVEKADSSNGACVTEHPGNDPSCGITVVLPHGTESGIVPGAFQSGPDGAASRPMTIALEPATMVGRDSASGGLVFTTRTVTVTVWDADHAGHRMIARDAAGHAVGTAEFVADRTPGALAPDTRSITADEIATVELVPADDDYVAYTMRVAVVRDTCRFLEDHPTDPIFELPEVLSIYKRLAARSGWHLPFADRVERGGFIVERGGSIKFIEQTFRDGAAPELCALLFDLQQINDLRTRHLRGELRVLRQVHTHPADGDVLPNPGNCRRDTGSEMAAAPGNRLTFTEGPSVYDLRPWVEGQVPWPGEVLTPRRLYRFERRSRMGGDPIRTAFRIHQGPEGCTTVSSEI